MSDAVVIRQLPPDALARLGAKAHLAGQSREGYLRDLLINEAMTAAINTKDEKQADGEWPFEPGTAEHRIAMKCLAHGFISACVTALRNGTSEADLMAAMTGTAQPPGLSTTHETPAGAAAAPEAQPVAVNGGASAMPHGLDIVSRTYTLPAGA